METEGFFTPETPAAARQRYADIGPAAQSVVREVARAMEFDQAEYDQRVTAPVIETARDTLFAALLEVHVGSAPEFDAWTEEHSAYSVERTGSEHVDRVAWHPAPATETVVATTFQNEPQAAIGALRRQAWGSVYRELLEEGE
ncbi:MAG: DUF5809 family protein [Halobacteriaceae archaeon]